MTRADQQMRDGRVMDACRRGRSAHYGARVATYEWDRRAEVFRLTSVHYPDLFEALTPRKE